MALANLGLQIHQSFDAIDLISAERQVLGQASTLAAPIPPQYAHDTRTNGSSTSEADAGYSERLDAPLRGLGSGRGGPLLDPRGRVQQPFVLTTATDARTQVRQGVFRSGHRLPTMSIEEYLEAEKARGGIIEGGGEQSGLPKLVDEDDHRAADRETMKQREWDEFKEQNPKGSGNTLNRG